MIDTRSAVTRLVYPPDFDGPIFFDGAIIGTQGRGAVRAAMVQTLRARRNITCDAIVEFWRLES